MSQKVLAASGVEWVTPLFLHAKGLSVLNIRTFNIIHVNSIAVKPDEEFLSLVDRFVNLHKSPMNIIY